jgi:hypothetical protein
MTCPRPNDNVRRAIVLLLMAMVSLSAGAISLAIGAFSE